MSGFQHYPLALRNAEGDVKIVRDRLEEDAFGKRGYQRSGTSDPAAFLARQDHAAPPPAHQEWPKFINGKVVHDPDAPAPKPAGLYPRWVNGKVVQSEEDDMDALMEADEELRIPAYERAEEREALMAQATKKGLRVDGRWGLARLREVVTGQRPENDDRA